MGRLNNKVAIVTGAASLRGFGFHTAQLFAEEGASVILTDLKEGDVCARAAELQNKGLTVVGCAQDVTQQAEWEKVRDLAIAEFGRIDILINNAGIVQPGGISDTTLSDWNLHISVNLTSAFLGCQMAVEQMRAQGGGGSIVNISSVAGLKGFKNLTAYAASKGGVRLLTKAAALDVAAEGIRINSVHPGHLETDMMAHAREVSPELVEPFIANVPMEKLGDPMEIATMNLFLASEESQYVTGAEFVVDGGLTAK
ncbi:glucose 1-dehydrogenase [Porticoccaceae bacterium]|jgi:NAD(P)-dependent dehydrogenase (short-subunit alcohol dehydrogenase family)|nr:glucose 1-dehydrogenase [Porticoccaceae bacterium]|tara:strand:- start:1156 stop:1920 length:765 start_codon:yes stop_codon:yes gene_type:complete